MEADGPIEECGGQQVRITGAPLHLESPVIGRRELRYLRLVFEVDSRNNNAYFADDLRCLWVPAKRTVILATGQKKIRILFTPRERKHALLVTCEYLVSLIS